jgi:hypothetical protein
VKKPAAAADTRDHHHARSSEMPATEPAPHLTGGGAAPREGVIKIPISVWTGREDDGQWFALALDFDIASMGASEDAALEELEELVVDYLQLGIREGRSLDELRRGVPKLEVAKLYLKELFSRATHVASGGPHAHRRKLVVTPDDRCLA